MSSFIYRVDRNVVAGDLCPLVSNTQIGFLNLNVSWTSLAELLSLVCILQVAMYASELSWDLKVTILLGSNLQI